MALNPILYADDEEDDAFFLKRAFVEAGVIHPLLVVNSGQMAIDYLCGKGSKSEQADQAPPCLALLDLNMPERSGLEVLKWIRAQPAFCTIPVILLTSSTQDADVRRAYAHGANGFLVKPSSPSDLLVMVKAIRDYWLLQNRSLHGGPPSPSSGDPSVRLG